MPYGDPYGHPMIVGWSEHDAAPDSPRPAGDLPCRTARATVTSMAPLSHAARAW